MNLNISIVYTQKPDSPEDYELTVKAEFDDEAAEVVGRILKDASDRIDTEIAKQKERKNA